MKKIILFGPKLNITNSNAYGAGTGGYTRNCMVYLEHFTFGDFQIVPCFHTIRGELDYGILTSPIRLLIDVIAFLKVLLSNDIHGVHVLAQYRGAAIRELVICLISFCLRKPVLYEIKAGAFESAYLDKGIFYRFLIKLTIRLATRILVEGQRYVNVIPRLFNRNAVHFPNVVPMKEIPYNTPPRLISEELKILFVGFAYEGKGIFELLEGCDRTAAAGYKIKLTIVGHVDVDVEKYLSSVKFSEGLEIIQKGKLHHESVLHEMQVNDVYCYPTKHDGEGHNNSINEALMYEMIIVTTNKGFIGEFLSAKNAYVIDDLSSENVKLALLSIIANPSFALSKAAQGRDLILEKFNSKIASKTLNDQYLKLSMRDAT